MADDKANLSFGWFLAGLGLGAITGVLLAPKSGRETREDILSGTRDGAEYVRSKSRVAADQFNTYVQQGREHASEYAGRGREQWNDLVDRGRGFVNEKASRVTAAVQAGQAAYHAHVAESHSGEAGSVEVTPEPVPEA